MHKRRIINEILNNFIIIIFVDIATGVEFNNKENNEKLSVFTFNIN